MHNNKRGVKYLEGFVFSKNGTPLKTQVDAWKEDADCGCGIDCCNNLLALKALDDNGTTEYPCTFQIVVIEGNVKGKVVINLGAGNVVKYFDIV